MTLGLFEPTVYLTDDAFELEVFAGNDRDQVDSPTDRFSIVQPMRSDIVREILLKLERAVAGNAQGIEVNVQGSREIIRDPSFPLSSSTGVSVAVAVKAASATRGLEIAAVAMPAMPGPAPSAHQHRRARRRQARDRPRPSRPRRRRSGRPPQATVAKPAVPKTTARKAAGQPMTTAAKPPRAKRLTAKRSRKS